MPQFVTTRTLELVAFPLACLLVREAGACPRVGCSRGRRAGHEVSCAVWYSGVLESAVKLPFFSLLHTDIIGLFELEEIF